jgi:Tfp pilus assembly pilus retraction ATPase PilT
MENLSAYPPDFKNSVTSNPEPQHVAYEPPSQSQDTNPLNTKTETAQAVGSTKDFALTLKEAVWLPFESADCTVVFQDGNEVSLSKDLSVAIFGEAPAADSKAMPEPFEETIKVIMEHGQKRQEANARAVVTRCNRGRWVSATLRFSEKIKKILDASAQEKNTKLGELIKDGAITGCRAQPFDQDFFLQIDSVADVILGEIFEGRPSDKGDCITGISVIESPMAVREKSGVLIFAGATKCAKSQAATATVLRYLYGLPQIPGLPRHLVTAEDPIESLNLYRASGAKGDASKVEYQKRGIGPLSLPYQTSIDNHTPLQHGFWVTSRQLHHDVPSLKYVYRNALRQTPACVFVGETRDPDDWKTIIELGSTGHLVVTTMHAGSITEAMNRVMTAMGVSTAFERVNLARTILGICHMRAYERPNPSKLTRIFGDRIILPSLWKQTSASISAFGTDGLASMVPNPDYLLGRHRFANSAIIRSMNYQAEESYIAGLSAVPRSVAIGIESERADILKICRELDLTEL